MWSDTDTEMFKRAMALMVEASLLAYHGDIKGSLEMQEPYNDIIDHFGSNNQPAFFMLIAMVEGMLAGATHYISTGLPRGYTPGG